MSRSHRLSQTFAVVGMLISMVPDLIAQTPPPTIIPGRGVRVVRVRFQPAATCSGVDATVNPVAAMVPVGGIKSAQATIAPTAHASRVQFFSLDTGVATVSPPVAAGSPQGVQLGGVAHGATAVRANTTTSGILRELSAFAKNRLDRTIAIHAIAEGNDDVQVVAVGQGDPNQTCVSAGSNGVFNSAPGGDDSVIGTTELGTGSNGICETTASGDDVQVIPIGRGRPNRICVARGANAFRDTPLPAGDDQGVGDDINTGADGICQTTARSVNLVPTRVPTAAALQTDLNRVWGLQANVFFTVTRTDFVVNYDLDRSGVLADPALVSATVAEINAITSAAQAPGTFNVYFVNSMEVPKAFTLIARGETWAGDAHPESSENLIAHEVGHLLGIGVESADPVDVMSAGSAANPCEVRRRDWQTVNP